MKNKIEQLEEQMKQENQKQTKRKIICPECKSDNVTPAGRWKGDTTMLCKECNYRGSPFLNVEDKPKEEKK